MSDLKLKRAEALEVLENAQAQQDYLWSLLKNTINYAGDEVIQIRLKILEDDTPEESFPLWMSVLLTAAMAYLPVETMVATGLTKLVGTSRRFLGWVKIDSTASVITGNIRAVDAAVGAKSAADRAISDAVINHLIQIDPLTVKITEVANKSATPVVKELIQKAAKAGSKHLREPKGEKPVRSENLRSRDSPFVAIKRAFFEWIDSTRFAETIALNAIKKQVREEEQVKPEELNKLISAIKEIGNVSSYTGEARDSFQQFVEKCIWCTTYNFYPKVVNFTLFNDDDFDFVIAPEYGEKFWKHLINRYPVDGKYPLQNKDERWPKKLEKFPHIGSAEALRIAYRFSHLGKDITRRNQETAENLLKAFR